MGFFDQKGGRKSCDMVPFIKEGITNYHDDSRLIDWLIDGAGPDRGAYRMHHPADCAEGGQSVID